MTAFHDRGRLLDWPYAVRYGDEQRVEADVLVLGGGIAGVWAAIAAARCGARVVIMEKAATVRSGAGGAGVDHWQWAADNPASGVSTRYMSVPNTITRLSTASRNTRILRRLAFNALPSMPASLM